MNLRVMTDDVTSMIVDLCNEWNGKIGRIITIDTGHLFYHANYIIWARLSIHSLGTMGPICHSCIPGRVATYQSSALIFPLQFN